MTVLLYDVNERIATLTINRPERRNSLSGEVIDLMFDKLDAAEHDDDVRVIVITCLLYTSPSPRDKRQSRMPSSA